MDDSLKGLRILVVEDHSDSRDLLEQSLRFMGAIISSASSAEEALSSIPAVDLVITDFAMPGESGVWLSFLLTYISYICYMSYMADGWYGDAHA